MSAPNTNVEELRHRFEYHEPSDPAIGHLHSVTRDAHYSLASMLYTMLPHSRERQLALTKIEEAMMWANACIARHQSEIVSKDYADKNRAPA